MPSYGRSSTVRSHRRGGPRRRMAFGPVLIVLAVIALVAAGTTAIYAVFIRGGCDGQATATVYVSPRVERIMQQLRQAWLETSPSVNDTCASVTIVSKESAEMTTALANEWDPASQGAPPDVWVPDSSAWVRKASTDADAERSVPDLQPSLARTPAVIAMPKPLADAAGMATGQLTWQQIISKLNSADGWKQYQHPEWGGFKVGLSDPQESTAGLLALMAITDTDDSGDVSPEEQATLLALKKVITVKTTQTTEIFEGLRGATDALTYVSAFPALEQDVLAYNLGKPKVPLVAVYPQDGTAEADFPYLVLNATWSDPLRKDVGAAFGRFARSPEGKNAFLAAGFRDGNRVAGPELTPANGVISKIPALPRAILLPESVQHAAATWTAVTRPTNLLFVFDTSGSTGAQVLGTGQTRLDLTKAAALGALNLFDDTAQVGVWEFSTANAGRDYRQIAGLNALSKSREQVTRAITNLKPGGNTGLYNTAWAACQEVAAKYQPGSANIIVLLTDGADDNNVAQTLSLNQLVENLKGTCGTAEKPVRLITVGLGIDSDSAILRQISAATKAPTFSSPRSFDVSQVVLAAIFS
jgi:Ca-activated chloride channel family protein